MFEYLLTLLIIYFYYEILISRYKSFLYNSTNGSGSNHLFWNKVGSFHGFPLLPPTAKGCFLGQLTYK